MNKLALEFIKDHEGCKLEAYRDTANVWTIGYGATGPGIKQGVTWNQDQCDTRLADDVERFAKSVRSLIPRNFTEQQQAALISFIYNLGEGPLFSDTGIRRALTQRDDIAVAKEMIRWDHAGGVEVKGLLIRRLEEAALFLKGS